MQKTVIFDLDGTIVDSEPVFFRIVNDLAPRFGYTPIDPDESGALKQLHLRDFLRQRLGWRIVLLPWILHAGRKRYHTIANEVPIFSGINEIFATLRERGTRIGIVSSSEERTVRAILKANALEVDFIAHSDLFGKARALKKAARTKLFTPNESVYIGDEVRDVEACREADIPIIAVSWGLNSKEALEQAGAETVSTREALLERLCAR